MFAGWAHGFTSDGGDRDEATRSFQSTRSRYATYSDHSILSVGSSWSFLSALSFLSIGSAGSVLSIGSAGSCLSIGSAGSCLSIGSAGGFRSIGASPEMTRATATVFAHAAIAVAALQALQLVHHSRKSFP
ncbi:MAG: hypothetical protein JWM89_4092 [Acidimicrobiales bacterium]|nr:hypothetical protein [Acidimicrobiales bacterium]